MQRRRSTKLAHKILSLIITFVCLIGIFSCLFLYWQDLNLSLSIDEKPVAVIFFKYNTAQRRLLNRNLWDRLKQASPLYDGDRVRTASLSQAVAIFPDGNRIELDENTLIQVFYNEKKGAQVDCASGALAVNSSLASAPITVLAGEKAITLSEATSLAVSVPSGSSSSATVAVLEGSAKVTKRPPVEESASSNSVSSLNDLLGNSFSSLSKGFSFNFSEKLSEEDYEVVTAGNEIDAGKNDATQFEADLPDPKFLVNNNQPKNDVIVYLPNKSSVVTETLDALPSLAFYWKSNHEILIQLSPDSAFNNILETRSFSAENNRAVIPLWFSGDYNSLFWRVGWNSKGKFDEKSRGVVRIERGDTEELFSVLADVFGEEVSKNISNQRKGSELSVLSGGISLPSVVESEVDKKTADKLEADKVFEEQTTQKIAKVAEEKLAAEKATAEKAAKLAAEKTAKEEARKAAIKKRADQLAAQKLVAEKRAAEKAAQLAAEKAAAAEAARLAAEKIAAEEAAKLAAEKTAAEEAERLVAEQADKLAQDEKLFAGTSALLTKPSLNQSFDEESLASGSIEFAWQAIPNATSYIFTLYKGDTPSGASLVSFSVKDTKYSLTGDNLAFLENGTFTWTIKGVRSSEISGKIETKVAASTFIINLELLDEVEIDTSNMINSR